MMDEHGDDMQDIQASDVPEKIICLCTVYIFMPVRLPSPS